MVILGFLFLCRIQKKKKKKKRKTRRRSQNAEEDGDPMFRVKVRNALHFTRREEALVHEATGGFAEAHRDGEYRPSDNDHSDLSAAHFGASTLLPVGV